MLAIVIILFSFIAALLSLVHSHAAKTPGKRSYWGMTRLGLVLIVLEGMGVTH